MNYIDVKFVGMISSRLEYFKVKNTNPYRANFRCPICGDSSKSKSKTRAWFLDHKNDCVFYCHNCGDSRSLRNFLKDLDPAMYDEYIVESKLNKYRMKAPTGAVPKGLDSLRNKQPNFKRSGSFLRRIKKISQLRYDHPARQYVNKRMIPPKVHHRLYYTPKFKAWVNEIQPGKLGDGFTEEPRLVIPFLDRDGNMFGFQGRAFNPKSLRYVTIMLDEDSPKVYGLDFVDCDRPYLVVEGPLDSLFLENCIAMAGADGSERGLPNPEMATYVFDNEPRNPEIVKRMEKVIGRKSSICIWPKGIRYKDINDMVLGGYTNVDVQKMIEYRTFKGLRAEFELAEWRQC
jgi:transcription elongation factor Elf1